MHTDSLPSPIPEQSDESLLELLRSGDMQAFNTLFKRHSRRAVELATTIAEDRSSAEEIVSDVFLSFWARRASLPNITSFRPYLFTAIRYRAKRVMHDKMAGAKVISLEDYRPKAQDSPIDPFCQLQAGELADTLQAVIELLPPRRKLIFKLQRIDGLSYKEIAALLELSERTVENQVASALKSLRKYLYAYHFSIFLVLLQSSLYN